MGGWTLAATDPPVFVVGHPRSGTSLLAAMLDRHPEVAVPPETHFFFLQLESGSGDDRDPHGALWRKLPVALRQLPGAERAEHRFREAPATARSLFDVLLGSYAEDQGARRWAEKSPWHLRCVPHMLEMYPEARIVGIVRDGRDVVESCVRAPFHRRGALWYAATWRFAARLLLEYARRYPTQFLYVRFEDLVRDPEATLKGVDRFAGLDFEPCQLDPVVETGSVVVGKEPWKEGVNAPLDSSRAFAWQSRIDADRNDLYTAIMGRELRAFGYPDAGPRAAPWAVRRLHDVVARAYRLACAAVLWEKTRSGRL